jgi:hypothetical protein
MNPKLIAAEVASGVSPVCATCKRFWEGRANDLPRPKCTAKKHCGSPIVGDTFSEYEGPMTDFTGWCFMCAGNSDYAVKVRSEERLIGVCKAHVSKLNELQGGTQEDATAVLMIHTPQERVPLLQLLPRPKKGLLQAIMATEAEWAEEDAYNANRR